MSPVPMSPEPARLSPAVRALVRLSGALAARDSDGLDRALDTARRDADADQVEEALLQSYLFLGYPVALNAFARWRELTGRPAPPPAPEEWEAWVERGGRVCETVYGNQYGALRDNVRALHPDMERWMVVEGYGKVLGRPGLPLATRELCIVGLLAVLGTPVQLHSHLRGALNAGASPAEVEAALEAVDDHLDPAGREAVRHTWGRVRERVGSPAAEDA